MSRNEISIIRVQQIPSDEETEDNGKDEGRFCSKIDYILFGVFSVFGIIAFCVLFIIPWTMITRTNTIVYQPYWMEAPLPHITSCFLIAGLTYLESTIYFNEEELNSISNYFKIYFIFLISYILAYILLYVHWSVYLQFYHPFPYVGYAAIIEGTNADLSDSDSFWIMGGMNYENKYWRKPSLLM